MSPAIARARDVLDLGGTWESANSQDGSAPATGWEPVEIPSLVTWRAPYTWFRRSFTLPPGFSRERVVLRFGGVKYASVVELNGTVLGEHEDGFSPFELSVPEELLEETNELRVRVADWRSALEESARLEALQNGVFDSLQLSDALIHPIGSRVFELGVWQKVELISFPEVRIVETFVRTSVQSETITVEVKVENLTDDAQDIAIHCQVREPVPGRGRGNGKGNDSPTRTVLVLQPGEISLPPRSTCILQKSAPWPGARLWSPDDPYLYFLRAFSSKGDELLTRFGFREFRVDGSEFYLNGTPIHLRATSAHFFGRPDEEAGEILRVAKDSNHVLMRLHAQPWPSAWYEAADELGLLIAWESAYWTHGHVYRVEDDATWAAFRQHLEAQIRLRRNHPSVVIWSVENEILLTGGLERGGQPTNAEAELAELGDFVRSLDPSRPLMFEGDGDPGGAADILNVHYPHEYPDYTAWPGEAWWLEETRAIDLYPHELPVPLTKPLYLGEFLWVPEFAELEGASIFFGDAIYRDPAGFRRLGKARAWSYQIEAYRALGVQGVAPWNIWGEDAEIPDPVLLEVARERFEPQGLYLREKTGSYFAGADIERTAYLFNDRLHDSGLTVSWEMRAGGALVEADSRSFSLQPAAIVSFPIVFGAPSTGGDVLLSYRVDGGPPGEASQPLFEFDESVRVFEHEPLEAAASLWLFDPAGSTGPVLQAEGLGFSTLGSLAAIPAEVAVLIVGRDAIQSGDDWRALALYTGRGGRALVLRHDAYPAASPVGLTSARVTIAFPREPSHPVLNGIAAEELFLWRPDDVILERPLARPQCLLYRTLIDAGSRQGLQHIGLMELGFASGTLLLSQLDLLPRLEEEPGARRLFQNILDYLSSFEPELGQRFHLVQETSGQGWALQRLGFDPDLLRAGSIPDPALLLASGSVAPALLSDLVDRAQAGSVLWLHKPTDPTLEALDALLSLGITAQSAPPAVVAVKDLPRTEGITGYSLNWRLPRFASEYAESIFGPEVDFSGATAVPHDDFTVTANLFEVGLESTALFTDGSLETQVDISATGRYHLGIDAEGTPAAGEFPAVRVQVDGETVGTVVVGAVRDVAYVTADLEAGARPVRLEFFNDLVAAGQDRNLFFYQLLVAPAGESPLAELTEPAALGMVPHGAGTILLDGIQWDNAGVDERKQAFLAALLDNLGVRLELPPDRLVLEAEEMAIEGDIVEPTETGVLFGTNGTISTELELAEWGRYLVKVQTSGTALGGVLPLFEFAATAPDGELLGRRTESLLTTEESTVSFELDLLPGPQTISLSFLNDAFNPPEDRNLLVDRIELTRRAYEALEAEAMQITAGDFVLTTSTGILFGTNGTIEGDVAVPKDGTYLIEVLAGGTAAGGALPLFEVAVDGQPAGARLLTQADDRYYFVEVDLAAGAHTIAISFLNDFFDPGPPVQDRNLFVDRVVVARRF